MSDDEFEHGRGRRRRGDDSSSSREPSPASRARRLPFILRSGSDDEGIDLEPTPPQLINSEDCTSSQQPLLRQPVGFGTTSIPVPTYSEPVPSGGIKWFLPGQDPSSSHSKDSKDQRPKKRRRKNEAFKSQSHRFRVDSTATPDFRAEAQSLGDAIMREQRYTSSTGSVAGSSTPATSDTARGSAPPAPRSRKAAGGRQRKDNQPQPVEAAAPIIDYGDTPSFAVMPRQLPPALAAPPVYDLPPSFHNGPSRYYRHDYGHGIPPAVPVPATPAQTSSAASTVSVPSAAVSGPPLHSAHLEMQPAVQECYSGPEHDLPAARPTTNPEIIDGNEVAVVNGHKKVTRPGARMVTILADDVRSGEVDSQLIEVKVPMRPAEVPEDGYWADAADIIGVWQKSAARIDGPARVYTLRGKYRQVILRVSATNEDTYSSMNVIIKKDRTFEVVIEPLPTPGVLPPPPSVSKSLKERREAEEDDGMGSTADSQSERAPSPPTRRRSPARKKTRATPTGSRGKHHGKGVSPSIPNARHTRKHNEKPLGNGPKSAQKVRDDSRTSKPEGQSAFGRAMRECSYSSSSDYDEAPRLPSSTIRSPPSTAAIKRCAESQTVSESPSRSVVSRNIPGSSIIAELVPGNKPRNYPLPNRPSGDRRGYETPESDDEPEKVDKAISKLVSSLFQKEDGFTSFYQWQTKPTADNMVNAYRLMKQFCDKYVGKVAPFRTNDTFIIEEKHLIHGVHWVSITPGPDFIRDVKLTLSLLDLYGKTGERTQDSAVVALLNDSSFPGNSENRIERLLDLLKDADRKWNSSHTKGKEPQRTDGGS